MQNEHPQGYRPIPLSNGVPNYGVTNYNHPYFYQRKDDYVMQPPSQPQHYVKPPIPPSNYDHYYSSFYGDTSNRQPSYPSTYPYSMDAAFDQYMHSAPLINGVPKNYPNPYTCYQQNLPTTPVSDSEKHSLPYPQAMTPHEMATPNTEMYANSDSNEEGGIFSLHKVSGYVTYLLDDCLQEIDHVAMCMYKGRQRDKSSNSLNAEGNVTTSNSLGNKMNSSSLYVNQNSKEGKDNKCGTNTTSTSSNSSNPVGPSLSNSNSLKGDDKSNSKNSDSFVCPYTWCRKLRSEIWHNSTCSDYNCSICAIIKPLIFLHSTTCKLNPCPIQKCQEYKFAMIKYKDFVMEDSCSPLSFYIFACSHIIHDYRREKRSSSDYTFDYEHENGLNESEEDKLRKRKTKTFSDDIMYNYNPSKYGVPLDAPPVVATASFVPPLTNDGDTDVNSFATPSSSSNINISLSNKRRKSGYIYMTCCKCGKKRGIPNTLNPSYITHFTCNMNIWDPEYRSCDAEEHIYKENEPYTDISQRTKDYSKYYRAFIEELQYYIFYVESKDTNKSKSRSQSLDLEYSRNSDLAVEGSSTPAVAPSGPSTRHNSIASSYTSTNSNSGTPSGVSTNPRRDILKIPTFGRREVDLYRLFREVCAYGGCEAVVAREGTWAYIYRSLDNYSPTETSASFRLKKMYSKYLLGYEKYLYNFPPPSSFKRGRGRGASLHYTTPVYTTKTVDTTSNTVVPRSASISADSLPSTSIRERSKSLEEMPECRDKDTLKALLSLKTTMLSPRAKPKSSPKWEALLSATVKSEDIYHQMSTTVKSDVPMSSLDISNKTIPVVTTGMINNTQEHTLSAKQENSPIHEHVEEDDPCITASEHSSLSDHCMEEKIVHTAVINKKTDTSIVNNEVNKDTLMNEDPVSISNS